MNKSYFSFLRSIKIYINKLDKNYSQKHTYCRPLQTQNALFNIYRMYLNVYDKYCVECKQMFLRYNISIDNWDISKLRSKFLVFPNADIAGNEVGFI